MPVTLEQFVQQLSDSGVMSPDAIRAFQQGLPSETRSAGDVQEFARELVRQKKLTSYQATAIYQGRAQTLLFGNYAVLDKLGQGGMGMVFKARHRRMNRFVALKVMSQNAMKSPDAVKRFRREVEAAARLTHPNIVAAFDADEARGVHFLVMEYVEGTDLAVRVKKHGPLPVATAVDCVVQAARGLAHAHAEGVVHRDIKPANLLIDRQGTVKVLDMGLARMTAESGQAADGLTQSGSIMGTVDYMSPEQALHTRHADQRADIYSLGCSLYYLLTGRPVFSGESLMEKLLAHREQPIPSLSAARSEVPAALDTVFARMLAKQCDDRYQTMAEVIRDLEAVTAGVEVAAGVTAAGPAASAGAWRPADSENADDLQLQEFLRAISPAATGAAARASTARGAGETSISRAAEQTRVSVLDSALGRVSRLSAAQRWLIAGAAGVVLVGISLYFGFRGKEEPVTKTKSPDSADAAGLLANTAGKKKSQITAQVAPEKEARPAAKPWIELFNGRDLTGWTDAKGGPARWKVKDGTMEIVPGFGWLTTIDRFGPDLELHAEFWIPKTPQKQGQARGNSGIYLLGRHEIQILDMFDNPNVPAIVGCGALYNIIAPKPGAARGPETWQRFDIVLHSPRPASAEKPATPGRLTVVHNGVTVIDDAEFGPIASPGALSPDIGAPGPIAIQDHGAAIQFRNLRVRNLSEPRSPTIAPTDGEIDLLAEIDPRRDAVQGGWRLAPTGLRIANAPNAPPAVFAFPLEIDGDYEVQLEFVRLEGKNSVNVLLPIGSGAGVFILAGYPDRPGGPQTGLSGIDGKALPNLSNTVRGITLETDSLYRLTIVVRTKQGTGTVTARLADREIFKWSGESSRLKPGEFYKLPNPTTTLGLGVVNSSFEFRRLRFRMLRGQAKWRR